MLAYSPHLDEAFCIPIPCVPFVNRTKLAISNQQIVQHMVVSSLCDERSRWQTLPYGRNHKAKAFKQTLEKPGTKISNQFDNQKIQNIKANRALLCHIICAVIYHAKQGRAFRGSNESQDSANGGCFLELLHTLALYSLPLKEHLDSHSNVKYTSFCIVSKEADSSDWPRLCLSRYHQGGE